MEDSGHTLNPPLDQPNLYQRKYYALKRKCEEVQQTNEKLVNRIQHVKQILRRRKKEKNISCSEGHLRSFGTPRNKKAFKQWKRLIMSKLDEYGDAYLDVQLPAMFDDVETEKLDISLSGQNDSDSNRLSQPVSNAAANQNSPSPYFVTSQLNPSITPN